MTKENGILSLRGSDFFLTEFPDNAYKVIEGRALVYVVRTENGEPGRRSLVCEAQPGDFIPSLCFRDGLFNNWRFCISALGSARILEIEGGSTSVLKKRFAQAAGVKHLESEGFEKVGVRKNFYSFPTENGIIYTKYFQYQETVKNEDSGD